jgi:hypothetical protein
LPGVCAGLRKLVARVGDRLLDLVDLTRKGLDLLRRLSRLLLCLSGLVALIVEIGVPAERLDREPAAYQHEHHTRDDPSPRTAMPARRGDCAAA